jgi:acetyl-CoA acyltransferase
VPATSVDRQCGSSQQAAHFAAQGVIAGAYDVVVAAGVEVMSLVPMGASIGNGVGFPFGAAYNRYADVELIEGHKGLVGQGISAEIIANEWGLSREDLDGLGAESQQRAAKATAEGRFDNEIVPVVSKIRDKESGEVKVLDTVVRSDEGIRPDTTVESLAKLKPSFLPDGKITAGNSSQICDGASAALIMSADRAAALGLTPRARFHSFAVTGSDPLLMLTGVIPATRRILARSGLGIDDLDAYEVNEAFACVPLVWQRELRADPDKLNPHGGAIALGHALGSSGTRLLGTLLGTLETGGGRYGLQTMCEGGGMANATIIERL